MCELFAEYRKQSLDTHKPAPISRRDSFSRLAVEIKGQIYRYAFNASYVSLSRKIYVDTNRNIGV
jgi:hypothetical protein